eukprot:11436781-Ditylum_brightwellii.AAC.1
MESFLCKVPLQTFKDAFNESVSDNQFTEDNIDEFITGDDEEVAVKLDFGEITIPETILSEKDSDSSLDLSLTNDGNNSDILSKISVPV